MSQWTSFVTRRVVRTAATALLGLGTMAGAAIVAPGQAAAQGAEDRDPAKRAEIIKKYLELLEKNPTEFLFKQLLKEVGFGQQLEKLIDEYRQKSQAEPNKLALRIIHGRLLMAARRFPEAADVYKAATEASPRDARAWLGYGLSLQKAKRPDEALEAFEKALDLEKNQDRKMDILRDLADLAFAQQDWDAAGRYYERMIKIDRGDTFVREEYARRLMQNKRYEQALEQYQAILKGAGGNQKVRATAMKDIGAVYAAMKRYDEALKIWKQAAGMTSGDSYIRQEIEQLIIGVYRDRNDLPGLIELYENKWRNPSYEQAMTIASLHDETGNEEKAMEFYRKALGKNRGSVDARLKIIHLLERRGATDEVIKAYEELVRAESNNPSYQFELAERYWRQGDKRKATSAAEKLSRSFKNDPVVQANLADLYMRWDMRDKVLSQYQKLVKLAPGDPQNLVGLGEFYWQDGKRDKAQETWRKIMKLGLPKDEAHALLGQVYSDHNLNREAVVELDKAIALNPKDEKLYRTLALIHERSRNLPQAIESWEKLLKITRRQVMRREARSRIIQIYHRQGQLRSKIAGFQQKFKGEPVDMSAGYFLGESHIVLKDFAAAERVFMQLLEVDAEDIEALLALQKIYAETGNHRKNIDILRKMAQLIPTQANNYYHQIAQLSLKLYDDATAIEFASMAVDLNPTDPRAHARLGQIYKDMQDLTRAAAEYRTALQLDPMAYQYYFELSEIYVALDKVRDADVLYRQLMQKSRDETMILRAGRKSIDINDALEELETLERELIPLIAANPTKKVYSRLQLELYDRMTISLIAAADNGPVDLRKSAEASLREISRRAVGPLLSALNEDDLSLQLMSIRILGNMRNPNAAVPLARLLDTSKDQAVRTQAALAVGKLGDPKALQPMLRASSDNDLTVRQLAVWAMGRMNSKDAAAPLRKILQNDPIWSLRALAAVGLGRLKSDGARELLEQRLADPAARDAKPEVRLAAAWALGALGDAAALPALQQAISEDRDPRVRRMSAWAMGNLGDMKALDALLGAYWSSGPEVREVASKALLRLGNGDKRTPYVVWEENLGFFDVTQNTFEVNFLLSTLLADDLLMASGDGAQAIIKGEKAISAMLLGLLGRADKSQLSMILFDLDSTPDHLGLGALTWNMPKDKGERQKVMAALERIGQSLSSKLRTLITDDVPQVRAHAAGILGKIGDKGAIDKLIAALDDEDADVRRKAATSLGRLGDKRAAAPLIARLGAKDEDFSFKAQAAEALGRLKAAEGFEPLVKALKDEFVWVQSSAAKGLGLLGDSRAVDPLVERLNNPATAPAVQIEVLGALRALGGSKATEAIKPFCQDPDPRVRSAAACQ